MLSRHSPHPARPLLLVWACTAAAGCSEPKEPSPTVKVGIISQTPVMEAAVEGFKSGMTELGYVEGKNLAYVYSGPTMTIDALTPELERLKAAGVDLIFSVATPATIKALEAVKNTDIPVVFSPVNDPVKAGIVDDLRRPGGSLTGVKVGGFVPKGLQWLLRIVPDVKVACVLHVPGDKSSVIGLAALREAASELGVSLVVQEVDSTESVREAAANAPPEANAVVILPCGLLESQAAVISEVACERNLPTLAPSPSSGKAGAMVAFGMDFYHVGKQAASLASKVLKGTKPADLPVETADFFLVINLKTAAACGVDVPDDILTQADEVVR